MEEINIQDYVTKLKTNSNNLEIIEYCIEKLKNKLTQKNFLI